MKVKLFRCPWCHGAAITFPSEDLPHCTSRQCSNIAMEFVGDIDAEKNFKEYR